MKRLTMIFAILCTLASIQATEINLEPLLKPLKKIFAKTGEHY